ncbi:MAG: hypothetical protein QGF00_10955 [Planctomycetota bacterium]|jgi:hypothetical protein|nr:hypothetical protein [Planctomycetota bacterium]MDP7250109.1 hypothetical protein [Planctomycetota bacterium]
MSAEVFPGHAGVPPALRVKLALQSQRDAGVPREAQSQRDAGVPREELQNSTYPPAP